MRKLYYPEMGAVERSQNTDYPYRIFVSHDAWARVMEKMSKDIDYANFKSMVAKEQGYSRANLYEDVWSVMHGAEKKLTPKPRNTVLKSRPKDDADDLRFFFDKE